MNNPIFKPVTHVDAPKAPDFMHYGFVGGYVAVQITLNNGVDQTDIQRAIGRGEVRFGKRAARDFTCGPLMYREEVVGEYRVEDLAFSVPAPLDGWTVGYYPDEGEFFEISPGGSITY